MHDQKKTDDAVKLDESGLIEPAIGLESEFTVYVDGVESKPEDVFGDPRVFLSPDSMHRVWTEAVITLNGKHHI